MSFVWRWLLLSFSVFIASNIRFLGISYDSWTSLLVASLLLGVANTFVRPVLLLIALPLVLFSLGVFVLFINAFLFYMVAWMVDGFHVTSFWSALGGAVVVSLVNMLLGMRGRARFQTRQDFVRPSRTPPPGRGPIIDV